MKLFFLLLLTLFIAESVTAASVEEVWTGENLESFANRTYKAQAIRYNNVSEYISDIKTWNPFIKNWPKLTAGTQLYTQYPFPVYIPQSEFALAPPENLHLSEDNQKISLFGFYTMSVGSYNETTTDQIVKSGQNFPVTFGLATSLSNNEKLHFLNMSSYWAKPASGKISGNSESSSTNIVIPGEFGFNIYYQYLFKSITSAFYTGYDYENLNTFNTDQLILGKSVSNITNKMNYLTIGGAKNFQLANAILSTKLSYSSLISSTTTGTKALTGYKYLLFLSYRPEGRISYNILYKHHELKGSTDLSINRFGISLGFQFF